MRGICFCMIAVTLLAFTGMSSGGDDKKAAADLKKLQGTWKFVSQTVEGKERPKEEVARITIIFTDDKWSVREGDKVVQAGTHKLDPSKKPAQVDALVTEGEGKGDKMLGIYELKGDMLKVCFDPQGKARPTSFTPQAGEFAAVIQRLKKKS